MPTHHLQPKHATAPPREEVCIFAQTNFRNQMRRFGIKTDDRRRHMYVIGKTGMGKTTMLENMVLQDIYNGHGVGVVDPHGDFAEKILDYIPANRINDVVYFNPADVEYPVGFNILEVKSDEQKHLVAAGLMAVFKKIWPDVWSSRMEYILNNTLLALLDYPGSTLLGINRLLADKVYRKKVIKQLTDPVIKAFWQNEFANYPDRYMVEAVAPIQNKIGQFLSANVIRNMVAQVKSTIDVRDIMDNKKIFIMNLSKGRIGEDNSRLLGGMLITEIQLAAMSRVDIPEEDRKDFFLYVDEFQNFATPSFANILSEARKYRLSLIMAHQYVTQLDEIVADAVFGNVGSMVTFRVGATDAEALAKELAPTFIEQDIVSLPKFQVLLKLMIDGVASQPFSAVTLGPIASRTNSAKRVIRVSRERYAIPRNVIADKILRWTGMEGEDELAGGEENGEPAIKKPPMPQMPPQKSNVQTGSSTPARTQLPSAPRPQQSSQTNRNIQVVNPPQQLQQRQQQKLSSPVPTAIPYRSQSQQPSSQSSSPSVGTSIFPSNQGAPQFSGERGKKKRRKKKKNAGSLIPDRGQNYQPDTRRQPTEDRLKLPNPPASHLLKQESPKVTKEEPKPALPIAIDPDQIIMFDNNPNDKAKPTPLKKDNNDWDDSWRNDQ